MSGDYDDVPSRPTRRHRGQIDGTPEDGESFFDVIDDDTAY